MKVSRRLLVAALAIIALGALCYIFLLDHRTPQQVADQALLDSSRGNSAAAESELHRKLWFTTNKDDKYLLQLTLGSVCEDAKNNKCALDAYKAALKLKPSFNAYMRLGEEAELAGDKTLAIDAYKKAKARVTSGAEPTHKMDLVDVDSALKRLGATS